MTGQLVKILVLPAICLALLSCSSNNRQSSGDFSETSWEIDDKTMEEWYMTFIGYDSSGYQSFIAESENLVQWNNMHLAMGYGPAGEFDHGGVVLGAYLYEDYDIKSPRILKKKEGRRGIGLITSKPLKQKLP